MCGNCRKYLRLLEYVEDNIDEMTVKQVDNYTKQLEELKVLYEACDCD